MLSILLVWQGVVWANPDMVHRTHLQPQTFFDPAKQDDSFLHSLTRYLTDSLATFEEDPDNRNLFSMKGCAAEALEQVKSTHEIPAGFLRQWPEVAGSEASGEVIIDFGPCRIRYYNPKIPGSNDPGFSCEVLENKEIGEYLHRQVVLRRPADRGFVSRVANQDDAVKLYEALVNDPTPPEKVRSSVRIRMPGIQKRLSRKIEKSKIDEWTRSKLQAAIENSSSCDLLEFNSVVLLDEENPTMARSWLLGFNTMAQSGKPLTGLTRRGGLTDTVFMKLGERYPGTIGLSAQVLDSVERDESLLHEYLLHEMICPYFGHERSRAIQAKLFPENYEAMEGDREPGHRDGELSLVLKKVIWDKCASFSEEVTDSMKVEEKLDEFKQRDFMEKDGPQQASHFFTLYKQYFEWIRRQYTLKQSRLVPGGRKSAMKTLRALQEEYQFVFARLSWIWEMEMIWSKAEKIIGKKDLDSNFPPQEMEKLKEVIRELLKKHETFMNQNSGAGLLKEDEHIRAVIDKLYGIIDIVKEPVFASQKDEDRIEAPERSDTARPEEKIKDKKEAPIRYKLSLREKLRLINWKSIFFTFGAALALSGIFYLVLPVNIVTVGIAMVLPITLFAVLLIKHWSGWKNFLFTIGVAVAVSVALSMFLPIPWFGLSLALIIIARLVIYRKHAKMQTRGVPQAQKSKTEGKEEKGAKAEDDLDDPQKREDAIKAMKYAYRAVHISFDLLQYIMKIIKLMFGFQKEADKSKDEDGKKKDGDDEKAKPEARLDTRNVLDAIFRLDASDHTGDISKVKEELRPIVFSILKELEWGFSLQLEVKKLKNWVDEEYEELAKALQEIAQEVSQRVASRSTGEESRKEMLAVNELISEYCDIAPTTFLKVRQYLILLIIRDDVNSKEMSGSVEASDYYALGRAEFFWHHYSSAEEAFAKAIELLPEGDCKVKEYYLAYGIVEHYIKKWDSAVEKYRISLHLREEEMKARKPIEEILPEEMLGVKELTHEDRKRFEEINKLRRKLTQELLWKAGQKKTIKGDKHDEKKSTGGKEGSAALYFIKRIVDPDSSFWEYARDTAPRVEERVFTLAPFVIFATLIATGTIGVTWAIIGMAAVYTLFVVLHTLNIWKAPEGSGLWEKLIYAFKAPFSIVAFNFIVTSVFSSTLGHGARTQWPGEALVAAVFFLTVIAYAFAQIRHENINKEVLKNAPILPGRAPYTFGPEAPGALKLMKKLVDPDTPFWMYALETAPRAEERVFTLIPFGILSSLMAAGVMGIGWVMITMGAVYSLFVAMHIPNIKDAPKEIGIWGKLRYAFKAPLEVSIFNYIVVTVFGNGLNHMVCAEWPTTALVIAVFLFSVIFYAFGMLRHENVNKEAIDSMKTSNPNYSEETKYAAAAIGEDDSEKKKPQEEITIPIKYIDSEGFKVPVNTPKTLDQSSADNAAITKKKIQTGEEPEEAAKILANAGKAIPCLVNALIAASKKNGKVVLALDLELGEGEINALLRKLIKVLPTIEGNNDDLERFFKNLEIIKGEGGTLARRVANITDPSKGKVAPENLIVITRSENTKYYQGLEGQATIAAVDDNEFSGSAYLPLLEIMLFAVGKYLNWDEATLKKHYQMIPNVVSSADLSAEDYAMLFGKDKGLMVIRLIPNATEFDKNELRELMDSIRTMLARA
ncbi:MAG: hypothetical protein WBD00_01820 [Candidatus Omnitrophota bacterium]